MLENTLDQNQLEDHPHKSSHHHQKLPLGDDEDRTLHEEVYCNFHGVVERPIVLEENSCVDQRDSEHYKDSQPENSDHHL